MVDANTISMPPEHVSIWSEDSGVVVFQWPPETMSIRLEIGHFTTELKDIQVREHLLDFAESITFSKKLCACPNQYNFLIDYCITQISDPACISTLVTWYMADNTIHDSQIPKAAYNKLTAGGLRQ